MAAEDCGSSPRTRGTRGTGATTGATWWWFIPAYTGNTPQGPGWSAWQPVHPRVHGEHHNEWRAPAAVLGSSPRTRGTRLRRIHLSLRGRFIPAYTGNTAHAPNLQVGPPVHPRVHGEHRLTVSPMEGWAGSSPRTRGTPGRYVLEAPRVRFIPAYTGNTSSSPTRAPPPPVHPRVHGEHASNRSSRYPICGSSPRTRGTPSCRPFKQEGCRFIPAYTGNTRSMLLAAVAVTVHPRVHGEHGFRTDPAFASTGSSPRTRGTRNGKPPRLDVHRFIPAYTGNTRIIGFDRERHPVHPRVHGEHSSWALTASP